MPVARLRESGFAPVGWFMNPNIQPLSEYLRRREAAVDCAGKLGMSLICDDVWDLRAWLEKQMAGDESDRCERCCFWRLEAAAKKAAELGLRYFSTSLLYSRYQPHDYIKAAGERLARGNGIEFVYGDFREDWQAGIDKSREFGLYRQAWCGCVFSEAERYAKKFERIKKSGI